MGALGAVEVTVLLGDGISEEMMAMVPRCLRGVPPSEGESPRATAGVEKDGRIAWWACAPSPAIAAAGEMPVAACADRPPLGCEGSCSWTTKKSFSAITVHSAVSSLENRIAAGSGSVHTISCLVPPHFFFPFFEGKLLGFLELVSLFFRL